MSVNKSIFIGRMGNPAEIKTTDSGAKCARFSIACTEREYTRKSDNVQIPERTEWIPIIAWRGLADIIEKYTRKGSKLFIEAHFTSSRYEDSTGAKRTSFEFIADSIELLDPKTDERPFPPEPMSSTGKMSYNE